MVKKVLRFVRSYFLLDFAIAGAFAALALTKLHHQDSANVVLAGVSLIAVIPLTVRMVRDIHAGRFGVDVLGVAAIVLAVVLQQYWAATALAILLAATKVLEVLATNWARSELPELEKYLPTIAHLVKKGKLTDVRPSVIQPGDTICIQPGEVVPVDSVITDGSTTVNESILTGQRDLVTYQVGDQILSGSTNTGSLITARAVHTARDSQYRQIVQLVRAGADHPAPFARLADRYSIPFTVLALTIGGVAWIFSRDPTRLLDVLVVATPLPLALAAPLALIAGMSRATRDGIIIKTGTALEQLAEARTFAFNKTGILTHGKPTVDMVTAFAPYKKQEVLAYAAALEQSSNHSLAAVISAAAATQALKLPKTKHVRVIAGRGLEAHLKNSSVLVGRLAYLVASGISLPPKLTATHITQTATFVAINGQLAGYITFHDDVRSDARSTMQILRKLGMRHALIVTGDSRATAEALAKDLAISDVAAEALPGDKVLAIERLDKHPTVFVGDGSDDAPALMAADVGIALRARGNTAASGSAEVIILGDSLSYVALAVATAKRAMRIAQQSIVLGVIASFILMLTFATGRFSPSIGVVAQAILDVLVILLALRAHRPVAATTER